MIDYTTARQLIAAQAHAWGVESVPLAAAFNRVLAATIVADRDYPPFNRATMDGYAIAFADFENGITRYEVIETVFAGQQATKIIQRGQCYKIMTGAPVPEAANLVIRREDTHEQNGLMQCNLPKAAPGGNIAQRGEDIRSGEAVITKNVICTPPVIALLASLGYHQVQVQKQPTVAVITTGNEVVAVDQAVAAAHIRNSNRWLLQSLLQQQGLQPVAVIHAPDEKEALQQAFQQVLQADIIISCGGVSAGDADFVPVVLQESGVQQLFHTVAMKPGKPVWCGKTHGGSLVFALPGNPFSCHVTFLLFVQHYLRCGYGLGEQSLAAYSVTQKRCKKTNLDEFFPVQVLPGNGGIQPLAFNGSGDVQAALLATGIALHPAGKTCVEAGEMLTVFNF